MTTRFAGHLLTGTHSARPAASAVPDGTLYSCTDHSLLYQSNTSAWSTWATLGGDGGGVDPIEVMFGTPDTAYEFDSSSLTGLTAMGTLDAENADTTIEGHYYASDNDASQAGRYATVSPAFTAICKISDTNIRVVNYQYVGMFAGEGTPGKLVWAGMVYSDGAAVTMRKFATPADGSPSAPSVNTPPANFQWGGNGYFGIRAASSTDVSYYFSKNGWLWYPLLLADNNSMTVGSVGISIGVYGGGTGVAIAVDFLRIWNSAKTFAVGT